MPYKYEEIVDELIANAGINKDDVCYFDFSPLSLIIDQYFQFCQQNLSEECDKYNIQPAKIYIRDNNTINAIAGSINGYSHRNGSST